MQSPRAPCSPAAFPSLGAATPPPCISAQGVLPHKQSGANCPARPPLPAPHTLVLPDAVSALPRSRLTQYDTLESSPGGLAAPGTPVSHRSDNVLYPLSYTISLPALR